MTHQSTVFLYGTLCDPGLLAIVTGEEPESVPATLSDHRVFWAHGQSFPVLVAAPGRATHGLVITVGSAAKARLDFYELGFGYHIAPCKVDSSQGGVAAEVYTCPEDAWARGAPWSLSDWQQRFGPLTREAARDYMEMFGAKSPEQAAALFEPVRSRAASRLRARKSPSREAFDGTPSRAAVKVLESARPFNGFFTLTEDKLQFPTFAGPPSAPVQRLTLQSGDAVTVLPYDPATDEVLVIRQFRHGAFSRGDLNPWCVEPPAGRIDPFETVEEAAHRELTEETGLRARQMHRIAAYYPTPGAVSEHLTSFVATCDLAGADRRIGGVVSESEDIMSHVIPFNSLMEMVSDGSANTGPLLLSALWLNGARGGLA